jgi:PPM family protein phosphatase
MSTIACFGKSDVGLVRANNEDAYLVLPEKGVLAVADGIGGRSSGEVASRIFVDTVGEVFGNAGRHSGQESGELIQEVYRLANERIQQRARENPEHQGMGCTADVLVISSDSFVAGHVGDSRTYLFRQGELRQITRDHSVVQEQVEQRLITPEEARRHPHRHVILRAVGIGDQLAVDLIKGKSLPGDLFLLCSDGLHDMAEEGSIREVLSRPIDLERKAEMLIALAMAGGGHDNVTLVLSEVRDTT